MRYLILLLIPLALFAFERPKIERDWFNGHYWLCLNDKHIIHDPDCDCTYRYRGWMEPTPTWHNGAMLNHIEMFREPITPD